MLVDEPMTSMRLNVKWLKTEQPIRQWTRLVAILVACSLPAHVAEAQRLATGHDKDVVDRLDKSRAKLTSVLKHTFDENKSATTVIRHNGNPKDFKPEPGGLRVEVTGSGRYVENNLVAQIGLSGDFDIAIAYDELETKPEREGYCSAILQVLLDDDSSTEINVRRRHNLFGSSVEGQHVIFGDVTRRNVSGTQQRSTFEQPCAAGPTGRLRIARRGSTAYILYAEGDNSEFQLVGQREVPTSDVVLGGIRLRVQTFRKSFTSVRVKDVVAFAEKRVEQPMTAWPADRILAEINKRRQTLPVQLDADFAAYEQTERLAAEVAAQLREEKQSDNPKESRIVSLREQLTQHVKLAFELRLRLQRAQLDKTQSELEASRKRLDERQSIADAIVDRRTKELMARDSKAK